MEGEGEEGKRSGGGLKEGMERKQKRRTPLILYLTRVPWSPGVDKQYHHFILTSSLYIGDFILNLI